MQLVCPPGGEGVGGQYFGRHQTLDWPSTIISQRPTVCSEVTLRDGFFYPNETQTVFARIITERTVSQYRLRFKQ